MQHSVKVGLCFGMTSAVITTLGLMIGLYAGTHSKLVVLGGILTIAIADAFSDALGIHVSEESENKHTSKEVWQSTISTFAFKLLFALTFAIPVLIFYLDTAIIISVIWGLGVLCLLSFKIAKDSNKKPLKVISEHLVIAIIVIVITHLVGSMIGRMFG